MAMLRSETAAYRDIGLIYQQVQEGAQQVGITPETIYTNLSMMLNHGYLDLCSNTSSWGLKACDDNLLQKMKWIQIDQLPEEIEKDKQGLFGRWKSVLTAAHQQNEQIAILLIRKNDKTEFFIGVSREENTKLAAQQMASNVSKLMDGAKLHMLDEHSGFSYPIEIQDFNFAGLLTGLPSLKGEDSMKYIQTLDTLASGLEVNVLSKNYAVIIRADAVSQADISTLLGQLLKLKNDLNPLASWEENFSDPSNSTTTPAQDKSYKAAKGATIGLSILSVLSNIVPMIFPETAPLIAGSKLITNALSAAETTLPLAQAAMFMTKGEGPSETINHGSHSTTRHYSDERIKYLITQIDKYIERIQAGSSTGMWNAGIYVLAQDTATVDMALNQLSGLYRGKDSHLDPVRSFSEGIKNGLICSHAQSMELLPLPAGHTSFLGPICNHIATMVNTDELAIECNLPRKSYAGMKTSKDNVRFSYNPPPRKERSIRLGEVYSEGFPIRQPFYLDADALVQHALLVGEAGMGKTVSTKVILKGLRKLNIPFLVIDPVKNSYLDMAIEYNQKHCNDPDYEQKRIRIFRPGEEYYKYFDRKQKKFVSVKLDQFGINAYQPAAWGDSDINLDAHISNLVDVLTASMGMDYALPGLLKAIIRSDLNDYYDTYADKNRIPAEVFRSQNPSISRLSYVLEREMDNKTYSEEVKGNLKECINEVLDEIHKGWKSVLLDSATTHNMDQIFDRPAVISLSGLGSDKDKAFAMSLLMMWMRDYRESLFNNDVEYRTEVDGRNRLMHLGVVEEAHVVMSNPDAAVAGITNPGQKTAHLMKKLFSEAREYGQGIMAVDQYASRLIEEARTTTHVTMIHLQQSANESELMANRISLDKKQTQFVHSLDNGHMIIKYGSHDPCWVKVDPYTVE